MINGENDVYVGKGMRPLPKILPPVRPLTKETYATVVTTVPTVKVVIEDPFRPVLKENANETQAARHSRSPRLNDFTGTPLRVIPVDHTVPGLEKRPWIHMTKPSVAFAPFSKRLYSTLLRLL
jgi:hypothetical protein